MDSMSRAWVRTSRTPEDGCQGENGDIIGLRLIEESLDVGLKLQCKREVRPEFTPSVKKICYAHRERSEPHLIISLWVSRRCCR